tara:strand:- start:78 stop:737 length:660 start_codon:yes stop_codon:yes gene_type:complete
MDLTLIIPAKEEEFSLPLVMEEIKDLPVKKLIILSKGDDKTHDAIKKFEADVIYQSGKGYGNAIREGIKKAESKYVCIFYADGSTDPKYLTQMYDKIEKEKKDLIFCSRYEKGAGSADDNFITKIGNFFFTIFGNIFFSLNISDILFTYIIGKKSSFDKMNLISDDVCLCVEIPIKSKKLNLRYSTLPSFERKRFGGEKKVNAFSDGLKILIYMLKKIY